MGNSLTGGWSIIGVATWSSVGKATFGKRGYDLMRSSLSAAELKESDLSGQVHVITGANTGLGYASALALAKRRASVHILCRNRERGEVALAEIRRDSGNADVTLHVVDVSLVADVRRFAAEWEATGRPVHSLINNAGVLNPARSETSEGVESTMATALVPSYLLTGLLVPALLRSAGGTGAVRGSAQSQTGSTDTTETAPPPPAVWVPRVINVSSGGQYCVKLDAQDLFCKRRRYDGRQQYGHAKRAQVMLAELWAAKLRGTGASAIAVHAMHPGWSLTPGVQTSIPDFAESQKHDIRSPAEGADTIVWLATTCQALGADPAAQRALDTGGSFWFDRRPAPADFPWAGTRSSPADFDKLWSECVAVCGEVALPPLPPALRG